MSVITNVILCTTHDEPGVEALKEFFRIRYPAQCTLDCPMLIEVGDHCGGTKAFDDCLYLGAVNYLRKDELVREFKSIPWAHPDSVELMLRSEYQGSYSVHRPGDEEGC